MSDRVRLLRADSTLAEGIPSDERERAEQLVLADVHGFQRGTWHPGAIQDGHPTGFAFLVMEGILTREVVIGERCSAELFGPGDVVGFSRPSDAFVPHDVRWTAQEPGSVAVLDDRFRTAARRWPTLGARLDERLFQHAERMALHVAIAQLGRVEHRLLAMLWHLADRWGRVTPHGVVVPLKLTHEALGRLVGAQRPTVTLALGELYATGSITRAATGGWLLQNESRPLLSGTGLLAAAPAASVSAATAAVMSPERSA